MHPIRTFVSVFVALALTALTSGAQAQVLVRITTAPPPLPVYVQPAIPGPDYVWSPGYWAWAANEYYWVPGTWVLVPAVGVLWTPGYWSWSDAIYVWHAGYWGPRVGFYGGINYGYGYGGSGYQGGYWRGGIFSYNTAVTNIGSTHITNVYNKIVINKTTVTNVSFNGDNGGTAAQPTSTEKAAALDKHIPATNAQVQHQHAARANPALLASVNKGRPPIAATIRPGQGIVVAKGVNALAKPLGSAKLTSAQPGSKQPRQFNTATLSGAPGRNPPRFQAPKPPQHAKKPECKGRGNNPSAKLPLCSTARG